jgi:hypothetical protein
VLPVFDKVKNEKQVNGAPKQEEHPPIIEAPDKGMHVPNDKPAQNQTTNNNTNIN